MSTLSQFFSSKLKSQEFTSSGTFTVPAGISTVLVTMTGGGGSGSGDHEYRRTAGGGSGSFCIKRPITVTPGANVTVSIGAGGAAVGTWGATAGNNGSPTSFGSVTVAGGIGGGKYSDARIAGVGGGNGGTMAVTSSPGAFAIFLPATSAFGSRGGMAHNTGGGGGGGGLFGEGTDGTYEASSSAAANNSGAGGGGATSINAFAYASGAGGSGRCIVEWME